MVYNYTKKYKQVLVFNILLDTTKANQFRMDSRIVQIISPGMVRQKIIKELSYPNVMTFHAI